MQIFREWSNSKILAKIKFSRINVNLQYFRDIISLREWINFEISILDMEFSFELKYRNDPKFSDRYTWANSADPDQTAPRGD